MMGNVLAFRILSFRLIVFRNDFRFSCVTTGGLSEMWTGICRTESSKSDKLDREVESQSLGGGEMCPSNWNKTSHFSSFTL